MSYGKLFSAGVQGLDGYKVEIEVDITGGLPGLSIVGLASKSVEEAKDRVRGAIKHSGFKLDPEKITVNLAPADVKKEGSHYDLAIAMCVLLANGQIENSPLFSRTLFLGELSLDGRLRSAQGVLAMTLFAREAGFQFAALPKENLKEASLVKGIKLVPITSLQELVKMFQVGQLRSQKIDIDFVSMRSQEYEYDFQYVRSQENAKRALSIAAAGGHNIIMTGPPGTGKTLLARCLPSILPLLSYEECLDVTKIYSVAGKLKKSNPIITERPFRSPHHTASHISLVGGGSNASPGEITLAHRGVLFLDEIPEFHRQTLEALRQPLEDGVITVSRAKGTVEFPASFILVASANPCPCGYFNDPKKECRCSNSQIVNYQKKLSGPFMDRIDIKIFLERFALAKLAQKAVADPSENVRKQIEKARQIQAKRFVDIGIKTNSQMSARQIETYCDVSEKLKKSIVASMEKENLSARGFHKILKISRTIADLNNEKEIGQNHLFEALSYYQEQGDQR
ncbi:MAG: Mg chelatase-related protein [Candidatus Berkelbacteria bacterium Licking1014_7]|uniref:Mg chelatase-related protein n=1 Tax=Candidatus Berkelbacteria bacterium Licking1014_7 TaxID=2017147 RepID=A0A554LHM2_9BACT|nr:MAG: Mg chelatase-related protein [Candidatus Berkelbacteria bacterium Licking1014_7]